MPDDFDLSQEQQADILKYQIEEQLRIFPPVPQIDCLNTCGPCTDKNPHGKECGDYAACLEDWWVRNKPGYNQL